jgi:hypothetical protein
MDGTCVLLSFHNPGNVLVLGQNSLKSIEGARIWQGRPTEDSNRALENHADKRPNRARTSSVFLGAMDVPQAI